MSSDQFQTGHKKGTSKSGKNRHLKLAEECRRASGLPAACRRDASVFMSFHDQNVHSNKETVHSEDRYDRPWSLVTFLSNQKSRWGISKSDYLF